MSRVLASTMSVLWLVVAACEVPARPLRPVDPVSGPDAGRGIDAAIEVDAGPIVDGGPDGSPARACPAASAAQDRTRPTSGSRSSFALQLGGWRRTFVVHVPAGYDGASPVPLVFATHGIGKTSDEFAQDSGLLPLADSAGFVAVFADPSAVAWNASAATGTDDVAFFRAMIAFLRSELGLCIDPTRVYAAGLSNGAMMTYRLACEASDVFAAVVSVSGALQLDAADCAAAQTRPVPLLEIHGNGDVFVTFDVVEADFDEYATLTGCGSSERAATQPLSYLDTTCTTREGCPEGVEITLCKVERGAHCWYGGASCGGGVPGGPEPFGRNAEGIVAADAAWEFVSRFTCPTCGW